MFKRTGWYPVDRPQAVEGPFLSPEQAAVSVACTHYKVGDVVFFDWDNPPASTQEPATGEEG